MDETKTETTTPHGSRIQPRRSSRSTISASPTTTTTNKDDRNGSLPESTASPTSPSSANNNTTAPSDTPLNSTSGTSAAAPANLAANHHSRVTRSLSADSNSNNEESPNSNTTPTTITTTTTANNNQNGKRRRHTNNSKSSNKKKSLGASTTAATSPSTTNTSVSPSSTTSGVKSPPPSRGGASAAANAGVDDYERETRNTTQRLSKEAKDARKAEREIIVKKKLGELELLEQKVKDQSHEEYQKLLEEIQTKRTKKLNVAKGRHALMETNFKNGFLAQKKSAFDKFHLDKLALRRKMMNHVQQQINRIEQEYFSCQQGTKSSLDEQNLVDWAPPDRPSMISSLTLGLDEQEISQDFTELQDLLPPTTTTTTKNTSTTTQSIEDCHPLDQSKKDTLPLIPST